MSKKKSRRHRTARVPQPATPEPQAIPAGPAMMAPAPPAVPAPTGSHNAAIAPQATIARPTVHSSHNLGLELRMIAMLGGGAIVLLAAISLAHPTNVVARLLHL